MNISRNFMLIGAIYLVIGIGFGMYMSITANYAYAPLHAHINLLGFVLMTVFGIVYRLKPGMAATSLAKVHFWGHQIGALILLIMLFLLFSGAVTEAAMVPAAPIAEILVMISILSYLANLFSNAE